MEVVAPRSPTLREALELDWVDITKIFSSRGSMKEVPKFLIGFLGHTLKFVLERKQQEFLIESPSTKRESGSCCGSSLVAQASWWGTVSKEKTVEKFEQFSRVRSAHLAWRRRRMPAGPSDVVWHRRMRSRFGRPLLGIFSCTPELHTAFCPIFPGLNPCSKYVIFVRRRPCVSDTFRFESQKIDFGTDSLLLPPADYDN